VKSKGQSPKAKVGIRSKGQSLAAKVFGVWGWFLILSLGEVASSFGETAEALFARGYAAYQAGDYKGAVRAFREAAEVRPAAGTFQNLGNAEWQLGRTGQAVLAWEQSLWLDPFHRAAYTNLRFARKTAQLESPELTWYEVVSSWLPVNWWAWIAGVSFWLAVGMVLLPGIFRWRKFAWHQALAAFGLAVFLLSVPAHVGVDTRSRIGFVLQKNAPLRLTPTENAQFVTRLPAGEPARVEKIRGAYLLIHTGHATGWVERNQFGLTSVFPSSGSPIQPEPPKSLAER
jgi:tetratricopeptide (TPR) repeat protein